LQEATGTLNIFWSS